jgi:carbonic anhydrase/acetyltransferase-like protein (isoleucine patch superfamily)
LFFKRVALMSLYEVGGGGPAIDSDAFIAPNAILIGSVTLRRQSSVWFGATLRGDIESIDVGVGSNIQDGVVMHTDPSFPLKIGRGVTVGHQAVLHGCTIGDGSLIGIQAVVLTGAIIGNGCLVGAGALVTERKRFPDRSLILGTPAKLIRELTDEEVAGLLATSSEYVERAQQYKVNLRIYGGHGV